MKKAKIIVNKNYIKGKSEETLFSSFIEHMGRCVYGGIYDPKNEKSDENGFRTDVIEAIKDLGVKNIRYPGGNFVSGYDWKDGIGKKSERKVTRNLAWFQTEPNEVGLDDFMLFAEKADAAPIMAVNLGTAGPKQAAELVEYCNQNGTYWADERKKNGREEPYNIKYWCLGNEMDGDWQIGTKTAEEYGKIARETAKMMRWEDPSIKLTACGSSGREMPSYPEWDRVVLEQTYNYIDYISLHQYYDYPLGDRSRKTDFLASYVDFDKFISSVAAAVAYVKENKRSNRQVYLSVDEWNVWHKGLCPIDLQEWGVEVVREENTYDMLDAAVFASLIATMLNHADMVKIACLAQLVNVLAPIMTEKGGSRIVKQTIYYPFQLAHKFMLGMVYAPVVKSEGFESCYGHADDVCVSAVEGEDGNLTLMVVSLSDKEIDLDIELEHFDVSKINSIYEISSKNETDCNTFDNPDKVVPVLVKPENGSVRVKPYSVNFIRYEK